MSKPSVIPAWATNGVEIVTPSGPKQISGWANGEKPLHSYMNWLQNAAWQWIVWLNGLQGEALTWTGAQTFTAPFHATNYSNFDGTLNANAGLNVGGAIQGSGNLLIDLNAAVSGNLTVAGTSETNDLTVNGNLAVYGISTLTGVTVTGESTYTDDLAAPGAANRLSARAVHKAHAAFTLNNGSAPTLIAADSYNVASVSVSSSYITVTFNQLFATGANPVVCVTLGDEMGTNTMNAHINSRGRIGGSGAAYVSIGIRTAAGALQDAQGALIAGLTVYMTAEGKQ